jgi:hypothetical protein
MVAQRKHEAVQFRIRSHASDEYDPHSAGRFLDLLPMYG